MRGCFGRAMKSYRNIFGQMSLLGSELTSEQLSGPDALDRSEPVSPYLDYSVWDPHHYRLEKQKSCRAKYLTDQTSLGQLMIAGPPTLDVWQEYHECAKKSFIMLGAFSRGNVDNYVAHFLSLVKMYGQSVWYLAYKTEVG